MKGITARAIAYSRHQKIGPELVRGQRLHKLIIQ
jgi:hypothetical protein